MYFSSKDRSRIRSCVNRQLVPDYSRQSSGLLFKGRNLLGHFYICRRGQTLPRNIDNR